MPPKLKAGMRAAKASKGAPLSEAAEVLAGLYGATLTAASFLAPKGVLCTLSRLHATVKQLTALELTEEGLRLMCGTDPQLALRYAVGPTGDAELELVLRESLRTVATPSVVRARMKRFRALLANSSMPLAPLPPPPERLMPHSPSRGKSTLAADTSGLPSPPPRPLRHAGLAAPSPPSCGRGAVLPRREEQQADRDAHGRDVGAERDEGGTRASSESTEGEHALAVGPMAVSVGANPSSAGGTPSCVASVEASFLGIGARPSPCARFLHRLRRSPFYKDQIAHYHEQGAQAPSHMIPAAALAPAVRTALEASGRMRLYSHQAKAIDALLGGGHVMLCTPTASGKSLGYLIPMLHSMAVDGKARALCLFPTKALAQDQLRAMRSLANAGNGPLFGLPMHTYDGDTPQSERSELRRSSRIFLTNPDMLHCAILPNHKEWAEVIKNLKYVVIDETHMYTGVFGAHVALILRRLRRLAAIYGASPSFACCSATVGNPSELFTMITGLSEPTVITEDGSPHGLRRLLFWNPPLAAQPTPLPEGKGVPVRDMAACLELGGRANLEQHGAGCSSDHLTCGTISDAGQGEDVKHICDDGITEDATNTAMGCDAATSRVTIPANATTCGSKRARSTQDTTERVAEAASGFSRSDEARRQAWRARQRDEGRRQSSNIEAAVLLAEMVRANLKTIAFCSVRKICELVLDYARQHLKAESPDDVARLGAYRGGLTPLERRRIERQLYDGTLRGVTATSSLELGVDIANLDGVVLNGFPGSVASLWQRAGRCGRTAESDSVCILIAYQSAIDQWVMRHPERVLSMRVEASIVDVRNPVVLQQHVLCAAFEQPLTQDDEELFCTVGADHSPYRQAVDALLTDRKLVTLPHGALRADVLIDNPAERCNIRSIDQSRVQVLLRTIRRRNQATLSESWASGGALETDVNEPEDCEEVLDEVERLRCWYELYEGAIYLNQGRKFEVISWEVHTGVVRVRASNARYYTSCNDQLKVIVLQRSWTRPLCEAEVGREGEAHQSSSVSGRLHSGRVRVTLDVTGFVKRWQKTGEIFEEVPLSMPTYSYDSRACWIDLPEELSAQLAQRALPMDAGLHALAHAMVSMLPLRLSCEPGDVGCECDALRHRYLWPKRLLLFDKSEGGMGIADRVGPALLDLLRDAVQMILDCDCTDGCYCCIHASQCTEYNAATDKRGAIAIAELLLGAATAPAPPQPAASAGGKGAVLVGGIGVSAYEQSPARSPALEQDDGSMLGRSIRIMRGMTSAEASSRYPAAVRMAAGECPCTTSICSQSQNGTSTSNAAFPFRCDACE